MLTHALAFIQARMSSRRFPGKVLAPFAGRAVIGHVVDQVAQALSRDQIIVATSTEPSDDPLVAYLRELQVRVFRGPLNDVFGRFRMCLVENPCPWFFRVCADSPFLDAQLFARLGDRARPAVDLVSNIFPRSFPRGQSLELVNAATFQKVDSTLLTTEQREHVTKVFYDNASRFCIVNVSSADSALSQTSVALDTLDDFRALEQTHFNRTTGLV